MSENSDPFFSAFMISFETVRGIDCAMETQAFANLVCKSSVGPECGVPKKTSPKLRGKLCSVALSIYSRCIFDASESWVVMSIYKCLLKIQL